jgi:hypothetical protein
MAKRGERHVHFAGRIVMKTTRSTPVAAGVSAILFALGWSSSAAAVPPGAVRAGFSSKVTAMSVLGQLPVGTFNGVPYTKTYGVIFGFIDPKEAGDVVGLSLQAKDSNGNVPYTSQYEIIAPAAGSPPDSVVVVEAENRSSPLSLYNLNQRPASAGGIAPDGQMWATGMGNGFLQNNATAYARIQWQSSATVGGDNVSVPATAQGVGLVIQRDFGRMLAGSTPRPAVTGATYAPPTFSTRIFVGISQSAWFVDTFLAEGFNDDWTGDVVFQGMIAIDGTGNWLAINELGAHAGAPMSPYLDPLPNAAAAPLTPNRLLSRPASDPFYIDVANYTDFYRVYASTTDVPLTSSRMRRYDWPGPHATAVVPAPGSGAGMFAPNPAVSQGGACDAGISIATNPIGYQPYFRALVVELEKQLGAISASPLPPSTYFALGPAPSVRSVVVNGSTLNTFDDAIGAALSVPRLDANNWPLGGVRTPDEAFPIGSPTIVYPNGAQAVSVPPALTDNISNTCGNSGVFKVFSAAQLTAMYGNRASYLAKYDTQVKTLIAQGYVLPSDEAYMLATAGQLYDYAANGPPYNGGTNF